MSGPRRSLNRSAFRIPDPAEESPPARRARQVDFVGRDSGENIRKMMDPETQAKLVDR